MTLLLLLLPSADAFTLSRFVHDWASSEDYCTATYGQDPDTDDVFDTDDDTILACTTTVSGQSNDTVSGAFDLGAIASGSRFDSVEFETGLFGSNHLTLSHGSMEAPATYGTYGTYLQLYIHTETDPGSGVSVDRDWYTFTPTSGLCYEVCFGPRSVDDVLKPDADWRMTLYDTDGSTVLEVLEGPDACIQWVPPSSSPYFLEVSDLSPELISGTSLSLAHQYYRLTVGNPDGNAGATYFTDADGDGFGAPGTGAFYCENPNTQLFVEGDDTDCDDSDLLVNTDAEERCNGIDDDCQNGIDDGLDTVEWFVDSDEDGFGDPDLAPTESCARPGDAFSTDPTDCNDSDDAIFPGQDDDDCDGEDDDCDGVNDDDSPHTVYFRDIDGDGSGGQTIQQFCADPGSDWSTDGNDCNDDDSSINDQAAELCDGIDNNCSGSADEGLTYVDYYADLDGDGFGDGDAVSACSAPPGLTTDNSDCNDANVAINPDATEVCDGIDNDCANGADDGLTFSTYYLDVDGDGFGDTATAISTCDPAPLSYVALDGDCDDTDPDANPGEAETCTGIDNDCDGTPDSGLTTSSWYLDEDHDGYGVGTAIEACGPLALPSAAYAQADGDCDDTQALVNPGAPEICDGLDNDCANGVDDGLTFTSWYVDSDGDGNGSASAAAEELCAPPGAGYSSNALDCNDDDDTIPAATTVYADGDGDGYGATATATDVCGAPGAGQVLLSGDCADDDAAINPAEEEVCANGIDDDCNGIVEDGCSVTFEAAPYEPECGCQSSSGAIPGGVALLFLAFVMRRRS